MICVIIGRTRHKMVVAEHRALAERGARLVELRLDWLANPPDLRFLLAERPTPVVCTCRRAKDQGRWRGSEEQRQALLRAAIAAGAEYVDLEADIAGSIKRYGKTRRIVSYHNFEETPEDLEEIHERLAKLDPDIVKIVTMANSPIDSVRMLKLVSGAKVPTLGFCMGEMGLLSRVLCGRYGAPFTYCSYSTEREFAPGQISFEEMANVYHFDQIDKTTHIFGVLGDPIKQSLGPLVQNAAFAADGYKGVYLPFRVFRQALAETLEAFKWLEVRGYSVTIPHKEAVLRRSGATTRWWMKSARPTRSIATRGFIGGPPIPITKRPWRPSVRTYKNTAPAKATSAERRCSSWGPAGLHGPSAWGCVRAGCGVTVSGRTRARSPLPSGSVASRSNGRTAGPSLRTFWSIARRSACSPRSTRRPSP